MKRLYLSVALLVSLSVAASESPEARQQANVLAKSYNCFGFNLFQEMLRADSKGNLFVSPASLAFALAMVEHGAAGQTRDEIAKTLQLSGAVSSPNEANRTLLELLGSYDPKVTLDIANSLWLTADAFTNPYFMERNRKFYRANVAKVDFTNPDTANQINSWVSEQTRRKIPEIVRFPFKPDTHALLLNAIYFKGTWKECFEDAKNMPFHLPDGQEMTHPRMTRKDDFRYYETPQFQAVELPYGDNGAVSMYVFLPFASLSLDKFLEHLNATNWASWMGQFRTREGTVGLPKFKLSQEHDFPGILKTMGMSSAFEAGRADFSQIADDLYIDDVRQKTTIEVNEKGTEAAAVTAVCISRCAAVLFKPEPFRMIVDRPFFFTICDNRTGAILFMGAIRDPR